MSFRLLVFLMMMAASQVYAGQVAFLGDSLSTGGAAHPYLQYDKSHFRSVFEGKVKLSPDDDYFKFLNENGHGISEAAAPQRLPRAKREFLHPVFWFTDNLWTSFSSQFLDAEEYSWAYLTARKFGYDPKDILIAARDGERMHHGVRQVDRLLDYTNGQVPEKVFIFFSGNDLCANTLDTVTTGDAYEDKLMDTLKYLRRNGQAAPGGTKVYLMNPVGVLQVVTSASIQKKQVPYYGKTLTCREIQTKKPVPGAGVQMEEDADLVDLAVNFIASTPVGYCNTLFSIHDGDSQTQITLSNRLNQYRSALKSAAKKMNEFAGTDFVFYHLESSKDVLFEAEDIANDCFHLSLQGHYKIMDKVLGDIEEKAPSL